MAPAPIAWTSTRPLLRITPAIAPATATGLEVAETFKTSTGARSAVIVAGTPSNMFAIDSVDRCGSSGVTVNGNQYGIECHGSCCHHESVGNARVEALEDDVFVHPDAAVPGPDHADVCDVGRPTREHPVVSGRDMGVRADHGARPAVEMPFHGRFLRRGLGVHVAEDDPDPWVSGKDGVCGAEGVFHLVRREDPAHQVHHQHLPPR